MESPPLEQILVCALCQGRLTFRATSATCSVCGHEFAKQNEFWKCSVGDDFPDLEDAGRWEKEELQDIHRIDHYLLPLFRSMQARAGTRPLRLLSVGCGVAADVERLAGSGFDCYGIDCGNRVEVWSRRAHRNRLLLANGMHLPFEDAFFDVVFAGCVFPHVGVVGDTYTVTTRHWSDRLQLAREMARVTNREGTVLVSCPNRLFPLDLFHRGHAGYLPRLHLPSEEFLLSLGDFRKLFVNGCGCRRVRALSAVNYWRFNELSRSWKGRLMAGIFSGYLRLVSSKALSALHGSAVTPWLVVAIER